MTCSDSTWLHQEHLMSPEVWPCCPLTQKKTTTERSVMCQDVRRQDRWSVCHPYAWGRRLPVLHLDPRHGTVTPDSMGEKMGPVWAAVLRLKPVSGAVIKTVVEWPLRSPTPACCKCNSCSRMMDEGEEARECDKGTSVSRADVSEGDFRGEWRTEKNSLDF